MGTPKAERKEHKDLQAKEAKKAKKPCGCPEGGDSQADVHAGQLARFRLSMASLAAVANFRGMRAQRWTRCARVGKCGLLCDAVVVREGEKPECTAGRGEYVDLHLALMDPAFQCPRDRF